MLDDDNALDPHNSDFAHAGVGPVPDEANPGEGDVGMVEQEGEEEGEDGDGDGDEAEDEAEDEAGMRTRTWAAKLYGTADMSLIEDGNGPPAPPPELLPARGLRRNPPVTIEDWPDPNDSSATSDSDDNPNGNGDQDPPYIERDMPQRLDPDDKPALNDDVLFALLEAELGDLADEEWIDMCKYADMDRDLFCTAHRRDATGKPRRTFRYTPLTPQLQGLFQSLDSIERMRY
ncbi:hypothetical protein BDV93DRAFT_513342 [Ceratobasidium sp. AG-I]|nr:hypothetical protein BDV93DRAFT_513342 [Ceratobasidium sp. AG-I]